MMHPVIMQLILILIKIVCLLVAIAYFTIAERKIMAAIQRRRGPNVVGFWGLLQPLADGLKLIAKEMVIPSHSNSRIFVIAPLCVLTLGLLNWSILPFGSFDYSEYASTKEIVTSSLSLENVKLAYVTPSQAAGFVIVTVSLIVGNFFPAYLIILPVAGAGIQGVANLRGGKMLRANNEKIKIEMSDIKAEAARTKVENDQLRSENAQMKTDGEKTSFLILFTMFCLFVHKLAVSVRVNDLKSALTVISFTAMLGFLTQSLLSANVSEVYPSNFCLSEVKLAWTDPTNTVWMIKMLWSGACVAVPVVVPYTPFIAAAGLSVVLLVAAVKNHNADLLKAAEDAKIQKAIVDPIEKNMNALPENLSGVSDKKAVFFDFLIEGNAVSDVRYGLLVILALSSLTVYGLIIAGWASNSKYAFLGALRSAAQMISYEVSISLVLIPVIFMSGSLNFTEIVLSQITTVWYALPLLPLAIIFFISMIAETNRTPFDLPEAEAELVAGYNVEYSSIIFAMFFLAEYGNMIMMSLIKSELFIGGWAGPAFIPAATLVTLKALVFCFLFVLVRATFPRYRYDQLMDIGWKIFLPLTTGLLLLFIGLLMAYKVTPVVAELDFASYMEPRFSTAIPSSENDKNEYATITYKMTYDENGDPVEVFLVHPQTLLMQIVGLTICASIFIIRFF